MIVFDGDEFTETLKKMDEQQDKKILEITRNALKKVVKKTYMKNMLKKDRKYMGNNLNYISKTNRKWD